MSFEQLLGFLDLSEKIWSSGTVVYDCSPRRQWGVMLVLFFLPGVENVFELDRYSYISQQVHIVEDGCSLL